LAGIPELSPETCAPGLALTSVLASSSEVAAGVSPVPSPSSKPAPVPF